MNTLATNRRLLKLVCTCPEDDSANILKKSFNYLFALVVFVSNSSASVATLTFFLRYVSSDLAASLYGLALFIGFTSCNCIFTIALLNRRLIGAVFQDLDQIYAEYKNDDKFRYLERANHKSDKMTQIYVNFFLFSTVLVLFGLTMVSVMTCFYQVGQFDRDLLYIPYAFVLPWHQNSPFGYIGEILFSFLAAATYFVVVGPMVMFFVSLCLHHWAFYEMFQHSLDKLESPGHASQNRIIMCELVQFHITAKDWFNKCTDVFSRIVLVQLMYSMLFTATELFQMDLALANLDFILFAVLLWSMAACALNSVLYCVFGRKATEGYALMANSLFESNWLELSIDVKKMFILMIGNAQIPLVFHGYRIAFFNLETLAKVAKTVITYYMAIRTMTMRE